MAFEKYQHIEKLGTNEVDGLTRGTCHVFPKIDGANASVWMEDGRLCMASRNRELEPGESFKGFREYVEGHNGIQSLLADHPTIRLFGEWLVPHTLKTYCADAWKKFYVFDALDGDECLHYETYGPIMESYSIEYLPCIAEVRNGNYDQFVGLMGKADCLIADGMGTGEGIVIKNYEFRNKYGRQVWGKLVASKFKEKHAKAMGPAQITGQALVEEAFITDHLTPEMVNKIVANIENDGGWTKRSIPRLLSTAFHDLVNEEIWEFLKKHKFPKVDFKTAHHFVVAAVKNMRPDLFD